VRRIRGGTAQGAIVVVCGKDRHPAALLTPLQANTLHTERLRVQVESTRPVSKRIWKQLVRAKIRAQAQVLQVWHRFETGAPTHRLQSGATRLAALVDEVRSGDPANIEAQAARIHWPALFDETFRRDPDGPPPNHLLNFGYMAVRAAVARALCVIDPSPRASRNRQLLLPEGYECKRPSDRCEPMGRRSCFEISESPPGPRCNRASGRPRAALWHRRRRARCAWGTRRRIRELRRYPGRQSK